MYSTWPFAFAPNAAETFVYFDVGDSAYVELNVDVQWMKPYITIGAAREETLPNNHGNQLFFRNAQLYHRCLIKAELPQLHPAQFNSNHSRSGGILRPDNRILWAIDKAVYLDGADLDGPPLNYCVLVASQSGTDYIPD